MHSKETLAGPVFFIGVPRSGTTVAFEHFCNHPDLAYVSNYTGYMPRIPSLNLLRRVFDNHFYSLKGKKDQFSELRGLNWLLPRPEEAYGFWNINGRPSFSKTYLIGKTATVPEAVRLKNGLNRIRHYQGKAHISAKLTGPGRVGYLNSIWPKAHYIHILRDGLDVVRSSLNVSFWKKGGLIEPWWDGGMSPSDLLKWQSLDRDPAALAALQWRTIIDTTRAESQHLSVEQYHEFRYEEIVQNPEKFAAEVTASTGMRPDNGTRSTFTPRNHSYTTQWSARKIDMLIDCMEPTYSDLGYSPSTI